MLTAQGCTLVYHVTQCQGCVVNILFDVSYKELLKRSERALCEVYTKENTALAWVHTNLCSDLRHALSD